MGRIFAILAAGAVAAGGGAYAFFHHIDPYRSDLGGCPLTRMACCTAPTEDACPASGAMPDAAVAAAGPVAAFTTTPVSTEVRACCAGTLKPIAVSLPCCELGEACPAPAPGLAAAVGPAAVR
ncbi:MAG TPA: hypothetical protein VH092_12465 [Urbifossiella sp.]|jgi:hypothetical protein|nr:hypothetical protein [Urbifossiella sp.]